MGVVGKFFGVIISSKELNKHGVDILKKWENWPTIPIEVEELLF